MTHLRIYFAIIFFLLTGTDLFAQEEEEINVVGFRFLDYSNNLPADILKTKSVVFVSVPPKSKVSSERGDWHSFATESHEYFKNIGIDAVAYYYIDDLFAGIEVTGKYAEELTEREIKYVIVLSKVNLKIKNKESLRYVIVITPFSNDVSLIANGQPAYKDQNKSLEKAMKKIYSITIRKDMEKSNNLILDQPEFFSGLPIITGTRYETYPRDLRADKLAVPKFEETEIPQNRPGGVLNNRIAKEMEKANQDIERMNFDLDRSFSKYPYKYELINYSRGEKQLVRDGFIYVLMRVNSSGKVLKHMLDFETLDAETDYITLKKKPDGTITLRTLPVEAPVHKFYIKNLIRNEVYVGESWDADETWQEALDNYLNSMVEELKK